MCGIAGALAFESAREGVSAELLVQMRDSMAHRGPDGAGLWIGPAARVGLAHRRLAIIDLSEAAAQPMANEAGDVVVSFNGEIYNHAALRRELSERDPVQWQTDHSDTEVVLRAFEAWGIDCVHRFRGMFAIAFWDGRERTLWLVRDRLGIKPVYYSQASGHLNFASEIKALLRDPNQRRAVDRRAFVDYLSFLVTPGPETLFEGIRKLPAGAWLRVREDGGVFESRYWDVWEHTKPRRGASEVDLQEEILSQLRDAVALRRVADVPVGVFLSGGLDSSANAALFSEGSTESIRSFSIGTHGAPESLPDELPFARAMAEHVAATHTERRISPEDLLAFLPRMIELQDEPLADPVCVPLFYLAELARKDGVSVCHVGEGSDELFCGYPDWLSVLQLERWRRSSAMRTLRAPALTALSWIGRGRGRRAEWLRRAGGEGPIQWSGAEGLSDARKQALLGPALRREFSRRSGWDAVASTYDHFRRAAWEPTPLHWMSYADLRLRLPELLLMRVDKMCMGVSLEARVPFLDHELVTLALSIPSERKIGTSQSLKPLLVGAVKQHLPRSILERRKQGFGLPLQEWFTGRLAALAESEIESFARESGLVDSNGVTELVRRRSAFDLWLLMNAALWWRRFIAT